MAKTGKEFSFLRDLKKQACIIENIFKKLKKNAGARSTKMIKNALKKLKLKLSKCIDKKYCRTNEILFEYSKKIMIFE